jgi:hypothetical protein
MVITARRLTSIVSLVLLALFAANPVLAFAGPRPDSSVVGGMAVQAPEPWISADFAAGSEAGPAAYQPPRWLETTSPPPTKSGSWWSRRTTAQKTWFVVGLAVGAYGVYALVSDDSDDNGGGGGGY